MSGSTEGPHDLWYSAASSSACDQIETRIRLQLSTAFSPTTHPKYPPCPKSSHLPKLNKSKNSEAGMTK